MGDEGSLGTAAGSSLRGTQENLNEGEHDELSSLGSDSELNGFSSERRTDRYGFIVASEDPERRLAELPVEVLRHRESKWLEMLSNWDKWMAKKHKKIRLRCQKGIPPSLRGRAWQYLSGSKVKMEQNHGKFDELDIMAGDPKWVDVIERDLHRQFPFHEMFVARGGHGQQDLFRVLKAYTLYRPDEGYCQAQAPIAAVMLMHMPAEQAFWCLIQICEKYLPGYYSEKLEAIQLDGKILFSLLRRVSPTAYKHLNKQKVDPILYMTEWFMCAFSRTLPWSSVLRVWDMFFCEGVKVIFRVGLVLLKSMLGSPDKLKSCQGQYETMERLKSIDSKYMEEVFLMPEIIELNITESDIEREHLIQLKKWKEERGELPCKSPPRMHGAKDISKAKPSSQRLLVPSPSILLPPIASSPVSVKRTKEQKEAEKAQERQILKERREQEREEKERRKLDKKLSKGKNAPANGTVKEKSGAQTRTSLEVLEKEPLRTSPLETYPKDSPRLLSSKDILKQQHQSNESLCSRESEDTYL
ncbi:TBC1 domain family member 10A [Ambystoma mexicanum]|uniref:TBC1 domain family member 10A n=1 Tax=Ambystoma mexicanum TaxID=8296 RepID=UPI0037E8B2A5